MVTIAIIFVIFVIGFIAIGATQCQVCGDPLLEKVVFCTKCKTPHHLDCWQYFGSCAVYGCGQKRYIVFRQ